MRILFFLIPFIGFSQTYFIQYSQDMKMAVSGPYAGKPNDIGTTYNAELSIGWEKEKGNNGYRVAHRVEIHPAIDYTKATWLELAYKRKISVLDCYAGVETFTIYRKDPNYDYTNPYHYKKYSNSTLMVGLNFEIQYMVTEYLGVGVNYNIFQAEGILREDNKKTRTDTMISIIGKI